MRNPLTKTEKKNLKKWANTQFAITLKYKPIDPIRSEFYHGRSVAAGKIAATYNPVKKGKKSRINVLVETTLDKTTDFVNRELGTQVKPTVEVAPSEYKYVAIRIPREEKIYVSPDFFPKEQEGQKTVLIHEISEIAYEQKGYAQPHVQATEFTHKNWKKIGGKDPKKIHQQLLEKGYYDI